MKKIAILAALALFALPGSVTAGTSGILGIWATGSEGGRVQIYRCGGNALCGKIVDATRLRANPDLRDVRNPNEALRDRKLKGLVVLRGFTGGADRMGRRPGLRSRIGRRRGERLPHAAQGRQVGGEGLRRGDLLPHQSLDPHPLTGRDPVVSLRTAPRPA